MGKERKTLETISRKLWLFFVVARALGMIPWKINGEKITGDGYVGRIYRSACLALYVVTPYESVWAIIGGLIYDIPGTQYVRELVSVGLGIQVAIRIYRELTDTATSIRILESLSLYDRKVEIIGRGRKDRFILFGLMTIPLIVFLLLIVRIVITSGREALPPRSFATTLLITSTYMISLKFNITVGLFYQRYRHLNDCVVPTAAAGTNVNPSNDLSEVTIHDIVHLHSILTKATITLAESYSHELLGWCLALIYSLLNAVLKTIKIKAPLVGFAATFHILSQIITLCWTCHNAASEANKLGPLLLQANPKFIRTFNSAESIDAAIYLYNHGVTFTAGHMCDVNLSTLLLIAATTLSLGLLIFE